MLKLGLEIKDDNGNVNITLKDPTKKQLDDCTQNEALIANKVKELLDKKLLELILDSFEKEIEKNN